MYNLTSFSGVRVAPHDHHHYRLAIRPRSSLQCAFSSKSAKFVEVDHFGGDIRHCEQHIRSHIFRCVLSTDHWPTPDLVSEYAVHCDWNPSGCEPDHSGPDIRTMRHSCKSTLGSSCSSSVRPLPRSSDSKHHWICPERPQQRLRRRTHCHSNPCALEPPDAAQPETIIRMRVDTELLVGSRNMSHDLAQLTYR